MSSSFGKNLIITIFGESHGAAVGVTIDGLPAGIPVDGEFIRSEMERRAPSNSVFSTKRSESDRVEVLSGIYNDMTTGTPICGILRNSDMHSGDYDILSVLPRPSHADLTGAVRYKGFNDPRGGGHFSGRLTAPLVFAGAICKLALFKYDIQIGAHIQSIANIKDDRFDTCNVSADELIALSEKSFPVISDVACEQMLSAINEARENLDSLGGIIECAIIGLKSGLGNPIFDNIESVLSSALFAVPAVKGVEFGLGFDISKLCGSEANDSWYYENNKALTKTNNNGGILGGISNGMPVIFRAAIKPTPSISKPQDTINLETKQNDVLQIKGRHDSCIVPRAVPVIEAAAAIALLDLMLRQKGFEF